MPFRLHARYVLLTYAQCGSLDPFRIVDLCARHGAECIVGRETHSDGGNHLHAFIDFGRKFDTRNPRWADIDEYHPNVSPSRGNPQGGWDYATKDGDICAGGLLRPERCENGDNAGSKKWSTILLAPTRNEFFERVAELDPRALAISFVNLEKYCDWKYRVEREEYVSPQIVTNDTATFFSSMQEWFDTNVTHMGTGR